MASETTKFKSRAQRYISLVELMRPVNDDTWANQKGILRLALSNTRIPFSAHDVDIEAKRMQRPVDDFSASDKLRILWLAFVNEDPADVKGCNLAPDDADGERFNQFFYISPMQGLLRGIAVDEHVALRKTMMADTRTPRHDLTAMQALDTIFGTETEADPRPEPGAGQPQRVLAAG